MTSTMVLKRGFVGLTSLLAMLTLIQDLSLAIDFPEFFLMILQML